LIKVDGVWALFDLIHDPKEKHDVAKEHPDVVENMAKQYGHFVDSLPPLKQSADYKGGGSVPQGWGWEIGTGGVLPATE
jgi:hypothetical protein